MKLTEKKTARVFVLEMSEEEAYRLWRLSYTEETNALSERFHSQFEDADWQDFLARYEADR